MLLFTIGDTQQEDFIFTLYENQTITEPIYIFSFEHVLTKTLVQFSGSTQDDKSFWPERYNKFVFKPGELFTEPGEWHYKISEQQTATILEQGILIMQKADKFTYTKYAGTATSYRAYKG